MVGAQELWESFKNAKAQGKTTCKQAENNLKGDANLPFVRTFSRGSLYEPIETDSRFFTCYINTKLTIE